MVHNEPKKPQLITTTKLKKFSLQVSGENCREKTMDWPVRKALLYSRAMPSSPHFHEPSLTWLMMKKMTVRAAHSSVVIIRNLKRKIRPWNMPAWYWNSDPAETCNIYCDGRPNPGTSIIIMKTQQCPISWRIWNPTHGVELAPDAAHLRKGGRLGADVAEDAEDHVAEEEEVAAGRDAGQDDEGKLQSGLRSTDYCEWTVSRGPMHEPRQRP